MHSISDGSFGALLRLRRSIRGKIQVLAKKLANNLRSLCGLGAEILYVVLLSAIYEYVYIYIYINKQ